MGQLMIRNIDDTLLVQLKRKAWQEGLPLETLVRRLLAASVETEEFDSPYPPPPVRFAARTELASHFRFHA